jgi:hypothetical protein
VSSTHTAAAIPDALSRAFFATTPRCAARERGERGRSVRSRPGVYPDCATSGPLPSGRSKSSRPAAIGPLSDAGSSRRRVQQTYSQWAPQDSDSGALTRRLPRNCSQICASRSQITNEDYSVRSSPPRYSFMARPKLDTVLP